MKFQAAFLVVLEFTDFKILCKCVSVASNFVDILTELRSMKSSTSVIHNNLAVTCPLYSYVL